ncbi:flippase-like domain-containing protein [Dermacoccus nishinomiyaensis]|nr:flippase-like domain-containing protein [Dermacoccus nishinomiyaensis]
MSSPSSSRQPGSTSPGASSGHGSRSEDSPLSPAMPRPNAWQSAQAVIGIGLAAAILYWGVPWFGETTWPEIGRHLQLLGWASSLELFALVAFGLWLYTFALTGSIPGLGHVKALIVNVAGSAAGNLLPGGGAAGVAATYLMLRSWGFQAAAISTSVIVTGVWNLVARLAMPLLGVALLSSTDALPKGVRRGALTGGIVGLVIIAAFVGVLLSPGLTQRFGAWLDRRVGERVRRRRPGFEIEATLVDQRRRLAGVTAHGWAPMTVGVVGYLAVYFVLFWRTMEAVGVDMPLSKLFAAYAVGRLLTTVGVTPGGLGVTEAGTLAVLVAWGADKPAAAAGVLVFALFTHLLEVPLGALGWLAWWLMPKQAVLDAATSPRSSSPT